ncbi:MAG: circularly permuted type 2 ATP-grasp protein [Planctomycetota bacterium]|nr:circularly permuted type 2 ATP-grasp protein [Planctomycetota bacterium]
MTAHSSSSIQPGFSETSSLLSENYSAPDKAYDEMWGGEGHIRSHWRPLMEAIEKMGIAAVKKRYGDTLRFLRENGVSYHVHAGSSHRRPWEFDIIPLVIGIEDWNAIERGMIQRAELLNLILCDIYGKQTLLRERVLPLELVHGHSGFLRPCVNMPFPSSHPLFLYGADLARGPDGRMWVIGDRAQTPYGSGYALENRTGLSRVLPGLLRDCKVRRLARFFKEVCDGLAELSLQRNDDPRIFLLTSGPSDQTYFEHAYLASYLGITLVEGDDLVVRDGKVWMKSLNGLHPVDVILRRVDDALCDPLELREDSRQGVAGLLEAMRLGNVAVVNQPGSGVVENPGLLAFLPSIAKHFLGEDLLLPSAATWWCGHPAERDHVLANLDKLVIKSIHRQPNTRPIFGATLSQEGLDAWRSRIRESPHMYVGQEQVGFSTAPALVSGNLEARHTVLRCFLLSRKNGYLVMPGGLACCAALRESIEASGEAGGISKDTWVVSDEDEEYISLWKQPGLIGEVSTGSGLLPSRAAENLFWTGRYAERCEAVARFLRTVINRYNLVQEGGEAQDTECLNVLLRSLASLTSTSPGFIGAGSSSKFRNPANEINAVALNLDREGSLSASVQSLVRAAFAVRDRWSADTWRIINGLEGIWGRLQAQKGASRQAILSSLDELISGLIGFTGATMETMTRSHGWILLDIGRRIERAALLTNLLRSTVIHKHSEEVERLVLETVLTASECLITYRRRYHTFMRLDTALDLLLLDETNPRSLIYQLNRVTANFEELPLERSETRLTQIERLLLDATTRLRLSDLTSITTPSDTEEDYGRLDELLDLTNQKLAGMATAFVQSYFIHAQAPTQLAPTIT